MASRGTPQNMHFCPTKSHFADFPVCTSVEDLWDRNTSNFGAQTFCASLAPHPSQDFPEGLERHLNAAQLSTLTAGAIFKEECSRLSFPATGLPDPGRVSVGFEKGSLKGSLKGF